MNDLKAKFRAWDSLKNEYPFKDFHLIGEISIFDILNQYQLQYLVNLEIEEWTGLRDKNNDLLYENDLFRSIQDNFIFRVWKAEGGFAINPHVPVWQNNIKDDYPFPLTALADEQTASWFKSNCYIIGNIKENPELLTDEYLEKK